MTMGTSQGSIIDWGALFGGTGTTTAVGQFLGGGGTTGQSQMVTYQGRRYRMVQTSAGPVLIPYRRSKRIVIGEKALYGVLGLIRTGASLARSRGRSGSYSFRQRRHRRRW